MTNAMRCKLTSVVLVLLLATRAPAQTPVIAIVPQTAAPHLSKFDSMAARTGTLFQRESIPIPSARAEGIEASVVRLEDVSAHEVVLSLQVILPEKRGTAGVSQEEMADLKDSVVYIMQNITKLGANKNPVTLEYRSFSTAAFGYAVHRKNPTGEELPATAYIEIPANPYIPGSGGMQQLSVPLLQKIITEAQTIMDDLQAKK